MQFQKLKRKNLIKPLRMEKRFDVNADIHISTSSH